MAEAKWARGRWEAVRAGRGQADGAGPCGLQEELGLLLWVKWEPWKVLSKGRT